MKGTMLIIPTDAKCEIFEIEDTPNLALLKKGIGGGSIEVVPYFKHVKYKGKMIHNCVAFCDEKGKLKGMPDNDLATAMWQASLLQDGRSLFDKAGQMADHLVGTIAVFWGDKEFMEAL